MVDKIVGGDYLQFTTRLWYQETDDDSYLGHGEKVNKEVGKKIWKRVKLLEEESFPFLDMKMRLTSRTNELESVKVNSIYPDYARALSIADVAPEVFPMFGEIWRKEDENSTNEEKKKRKDGWTTYFVLGYSKFICTANIPKLIESLQKCYNLKWIGISMAYYQRFPNMQERFSGDLGAKITRGL
eukprot:10841097-Ditylum_brightwellii.AAC.1